MTGQKYKIELPDDIKFEQVLKKINGLSFATLKDAYSPFPEHSFVEEDDRFARTPTLLIAFIFGAIGFATAAAIQIYPNVFSYPLRVGGLPKLALPSFFIVCYEFFILFATFGLILNLFRVLLFTSQDTESYSDQYLIFCEVEENHNNSFVELLSADSDIKWEMVR